ncbi:uncharacterized protein TRIADDRAFT_56046 [Trichoplax adhaerens]|uniref:Uncharacterized protein n=1 Tax=Trichoplax adhaerens TaxID=10228 RepID=B3RTU0_TRIAD|nr:predicted protein [Trichoplax adhaerens]EDV25684.1 predicted protein [Trichoplax adhaerens]|eukprot:XP_002111717.1 predicted protein [Trichoplax adhaerens]
MESKYELNPSDLHVSINSLPGLIILQKSSPSNNNHQQGVVYRTRLMAYYCRNDSLPSVCKLYYNIPTFTHTQKTKRRRTRDYNRHTDIIRRFFNSDSDAINYPVGCYSVRIFVDDNQSCLITKDRRRDAYHPIAFLRDNKLIGGLYANFDRYVHPSLSEKVISIDEKPIRSIITAVCLYGYNLKGIDNCENQYPITSATHNLQQDQTIERIKLECDEWHPYEKLIHQTLENMVPFFYVIGKGTMPTLYFHLPIAEYIIVGLQLFLTNYMTRKAFDDYIDYITERSRKHRQWLDNYSSRYNITLITEAPISRLVLERNDEFCLQRFMDGIDVPLSLLNGIDKESGNKIAEHVSQRCWIWLCESQVEPYRSVWRYIKSQKDLHCNEEELYNGYSLISLKYISYIAYLACVKQMEKVGQVLMVQPLDEKQVSVAYKNLLGDKYGGILGFHWMVPIVSNISTMDTLFTLKDYLAPLDNLIENGIIKQCFLESGAAATNLDKNSIVSYTKIKEQLLSKHRYLLTQQIDSIS